MRIALWPFDRRGEGEFVMNVDQSVRAAAVAKFAPPVLIAALIAGGSYVFGMDAGLSEGSMLLWKGAGCWLLAIYAGLNARNMDGWMIALVMALGAMGDVLVERDLTLGSLVFIVGHVVAAILYLRNRRPHLTPSQRWLTIVLVPAVMLIAWSLTRDDMVLIYSLFLAIMASSAWISRFPRYRTGIGAMLFVASDLLIFARMGPLAESGWVTPLIWLLYFAGQLLIVMGVVRTLGGRTFASQ
jgi:uncharacterized membrane protein YhhN